MCVGIVIIWCRSYSKYIFNVFVHKLQFVKYFVILVNISSAATHFLLRVMDM